MAAGELSRAREIRAESAARAASKVWIAEARLLRDVARLRQPGLVATRLAELAQTVDGDLVAAMAGHAAAWRLATWPGSRPPGMRSRQPGTSPLAAEASTAASSAYRSDGLARLASASARLADKLIAACRDVRTPGLAASGTPEGWRRAAPQKGLTRREREIARLEAGGASSREIAGALFLSVRTVDNALQNFYGKLGVASREVVARILRS